MKKAMLMISVLSGLFISCNLPVEDYAEDLGKKVVDTYTEKLEESEKLELINEASPLAGEVYGTYIWIQNQKENYDNVTSFVKEYL